VRKQKVIYQTKERHALFIKKQLHTNSSRDYDFTLNLQYALKILLRFKTSSKQDYSIICFIAFSMLITNL